jgi:hypothetical protein
LLFNYFQNLMLAHYCPQKTSQERVAEWVGNEESMGCQGVYDGHAQLFWHESDANYP